jgi:serine/threonine-protein kinase
MMINVASPSPVQPGQILAEKYRVERILGAGGMGVVVAARHEELNILVAIKFLLPHVLSNQDAVSRFAREARAAVRIKSEHVSRVTDVGTLDTGAPYMVMEYLEGTDLASYLHARTRLSVDKSVHFVLQACQAIAEAHLLGIVHRDLKPANLFLTRAADGSDIVKVLDFGISKNIDPDASHTGSMTTAAGALGSPTYMSPEQLTEAGQVDERTDIWALGVILFELLVGFPPFRADNLPKLFLAILHQNPPSPAQARPGLPPALVNAILRCLEKDRTKRFANIDELAVALSEVAPARARLSIERIARLTSAGGVASRSSSHMRSASSDSMRDTSPRPDLLSSADGWGPPAPLPAMGPFNVRRRLMLVGVPAALIVAFATYWLVHRGSAPNSAATAPSTSAPQQQNAPKDTSIKAK